MALIRCPECNQGVSDKAEQCPKCGCPVSKMVIIPETIECLECKKVFPLNDETCPDCGLFNSQKYKYVIQQEEVTQTNNTTVIIRNAKSRSIAIILTLFLGAIGAHKFYLGKTGLGIIYLLFFWTAIPLIVSFVEAILFIFMSDSEFDRKFNKNISRYS